MTFAEQMAERLVGNGMWAKDTTAVLDAYAKSDAGEAMADRMDHDMEGYPPQITGVIWIGVRAVARDWIVEHQPNAWYRSMFEDADQ